MFWPALTFAQKHVFNNSQNSKNCFKKKYNPSELN